MSGQFPQILALIALLSVHASSYGNIAYVPQALKKCVTFAHENVEKAENIANLQELYAVINANRAFTSASLVRKAVNEALNVLKNKGQVRSVGNNAIEAYLTQYLISLDDKSVVLNLEGDEASVKSWPISTVARCLKNSINMDMIHLSSELRGLKNISLCGNADIDFDDAIDRSIKENKKSDPSIAFTPSMMTNAASNFPNVLFAGTGVSSPVINAWAMTPSSSTQLPINMQFGIPGDLKTEKAMSVELHFLVTKESVLNGNARIRIDAKYMQQDGDFNIYDASPSFTYTTDSGDFFIAEPTSSNDVKHVYVIIPIEKSGIENYDFAFLSISRIAPTVGPEYSEDIYLAAAAFRYTHKT